MLTSYNFSFNSTLDRFTSKLEEIEKNISTVESLVPKIKEEARAWDQLVIENKHHLPEWDKLGKEPLTPRINKSLEQYQALVASARKELPALNAAHSDIHNKAEKIMHEGESIMKQAKASVRCD